MLKDLDSSIAGLNVILVEDILDTGLTLTIFCVFCGSGGLKRSGSRRFSTSPRGG